MCKLKGLKLLQPNYIKIISAKAGLAHCNYPCDLKKLKNYHIGHDTICTYF